MDEPIDRSERRRGITADGHMHTPLCGHAMGHPTEYVQAAANAGLQRVTFTCHTPLDLESFGGPGIRMRASQLSEYVDLVDEAREFGRPLGVEVLLGIEAEITADERALEIMDDALASRPFDFILGSLHHQLPSYRDYIRRLGLEDDDAIIRNYFELLILGIESQRYHSIAHPDVIRIYGTVAPFDPVDYESVIREALRAAARHGVMWEINTSGLTKGVFELHPAPIVFQWAREEGVGFTTGSDSHQPRRVGESFGAVEALLRENGIQEVYSFKGGRRETIAIDSRPLTNSIKSH